MTPAPYVIREMLTDAWQWSLTSAPIFHYSDFAALSGLALQGDATLEDSRLRLTAAADETGAAWYATPVDILSEPFVTSFTFQTTHAGSGSEGFAFVLQSSGAVDARRRRFLVGYIPYALSRDQEFDTVQNLDFTDRAADHVSLLLFPPGMSHPDHVEMELAGGPVGFGPLDDGQPHTARLAGQMDVDLGNSCCRCSSTRTGVDAGSASGCSGARWEWRPSMPRSGSPPRRAAAQIPPPTTSSTGPSPPGREWCGLPVDVPGAHVFSGLNSATAALSMRGPISSSTKGNTSTSRPT